MRYDLNQRVQKLNSISRVRFLTNDMFEFEFFLMLFFKFLPVFFEHFLVTVVLLIPEQFLEISLIQISSLWLVHCMMLLILGRIIFVTV